jgi:hypothetical protein
MLYSYVLPPGKDVSKNVCLKLREVTQNDRRRSMTLGNLPAVIGTCLRVFIDIWKVCVPLYHSAWHDDI